MLIVIPGAITDVQVKNVLWKNVLKGHFKIHQWWSLHMKASITITVLQHWEATRLQCCHLRYYLHHHHQLQLQESQAILRSSFLICFPLLSISLIIIIKPSIHRSSFISFLIMVCFRTWFPPSCTNITHKRYQFWTLRYTYIYIHKYIYTHMYLHLPSDIYIWHMCTATRVWKDHLKH